MSLDDEARAELQQLAEIHRLREPRVVDGRQGPRLTLDGVDVLNLASNDYLGLAGDRRLVDAGRDALERDGAGAGASRLVVGHHRRHAELERALGEWLEVSGVRLFNTGYAANVGVLTTLLAAGDVVFSDELNHASIIDGCRLSRAEIIVFPHRDTAALEVALGRHRGRRRIVISETLFSMDGDVADVVALAALCHRHDAALVLDEAHAIGVWGPQGRGIAAAVGVVPDVLIGTCGKALGSFGAFAATTDAIAALLWNRARTFVFSTALPVAVPAMVLAALEIVRGVEGDQRRRALAAHGRALRARVPSALGAPDSAIAPVIVGDDRSAVALSERMLRAGVFVQAIRPPTVPERGARIRLSLCASHDAEQLEMAGELLNDAMSQIR